MKRLKHLLWIVPLLLVAAAVALAVVAARARARDDAYHQALARSIQVRSDDFEHLEEIPTRFSCSGEGISPQIEWTPGPEGTRSYALIATDWDAPSPGIRLLSVPHWILFDIPAGLREIPRDSGSEDLGGDGIVVGVAMGGVEGYLPPCPPIGRHRYQFRVYALDLDTIPTRARSRTEVLAAIEGHVLAYGELIGLRTARHRLAVMDEP